MEQYNGSNGNSYTTLSDIASENSISSYFREIPYIQKNTYGSLSAIYRNTNRFDDISNVGYNRIGYSDTKY